MVPTGDGQGSLDAAVQRNWLSAAQLSSAVSLLERNLDRSGFDRAPWLVVAFSAGIASWFLMPGPLQWALSIIICVLVAVSAAAVWRDDGSRSHLRMAVIALSVMFALGVATIWTRSEMVGATPVDRPMVTTLSGYVIDRENQPAQKRARLTLAIREADRGAALKVRVNVDEDDLYPSVSEGSIIKLRARLMPPAPPMFPGGYNFARRAWFDGLAATGSAIGQVEVIDGDPAQSGLANVQRRLASHVRSQLDGSAGAIAAAFASGDRGAISPADDEAMRDAGLTHLLSISGLHVSALIAGAYFLAIRLLALFPAIALRARLPIVAAAVAAGAGIGYTLLTGAEVPTVRSCVAALLVLGALVLGREPLSLRLVAVAAFTVLLLWPEAIAGPSFQMSFAAVITIIALHGSRPVREFLSPRDENWLARFGRRTLMLLVTGFVIEIALMPIVLFHFHRAGVYGALANVIAIPLVTFVSMPLIAFALALDVVGLGAPAWWIVEQSLDLLLKIAHTTAAQPGAVKLMPQMTYATFGFFIAGGLWLALWSGRFRLLSAVPIAIGCIMLARTPVPDLLISSDGRHVAITMPDNRLLSLRDTRSDYARDNMIELAGTRSEPVPVETWPSADCSPEFCVLDIERDGRKWSLLMARNRVRVEERSLAAACERSDIVVADRWLPASCRPLWLKADAAYLRENGGLSIDVEGREITTVASAQGQHGWWQAAEK